MANPLQALTSAALKEAAVIKEQIEHLGNRLVQILGGDDSEPTKGRRTVSAQTRAKMRAAQRARRARLGGESTETSSASPAKRRKRKTMSAEARAKIAAAQRRRWAERRRAGGRA